jgi:hypothetical protein
MSKKDYQAIARALYKTRITAKPDLPPVAVAMWQRACADVADALKADNPAFSRERFAEACETGTTRGMRS